MQVQLLRRIGGCEQHQLPDGSADLCPAQSAFLCELCGVLLCGSHAGPHTHTMPAAPTAIAETSANEASPTGTLDIRFADIDETHA